MKQTGERRAGNPHAAFEEAGAGNVAWSRCCDTRRRKSEATGNTNFDLNRRASLRPYRENLHGDAKGKGTSGADRKAESTDAGSRDGVARSSEEDPVTGSERRRDIVRLYRKVNRKREDPFG